MLYDVSRSRPSLPRWLCLLAASTSMRMDTCLVRGANTQEAVIDAAHGTVHMSSQYYGVDASWPMQNPYVASSSLENHHPNPLGADAREYAYREYLQGCIVGKEDYDTFSQNDKTYYDECVRFEADRIQMNSRQPSISQNYTHAGFAKVETPALVRKMLEEVWEEHEENKVLEQWERGNTYLNHWQSPTHLVDVTQILSHAQQHKLVQAVQSVLEAWTQTPLVLTSLYGIRVYGNGAVLAPHVDRLPLVSSAIINVAQSMGEKEDEPWILEVIGHDGRATNVTMEPGDMVLYESHSVIHGRPFPFQGNYFANVFVHFEPLGHSFRHMQHNTEKGDESSAQASYERALARQQQQSRKTTHYPKQKSNTKVKYDGDPVMDEEQAPTAALPSYVPKDKEVRWRQQFVYEKESEVRLVVWSCTYTHIHPFQ
jgi:prolyl 4-hydroxylase